VWEPAGPPQIVLPRLGYAVDVARPVPSRNDEVKRALLWIASASMEASEVRKKAALLSSLWVPFSKIKYAFIINKGLRKGRKKITRPRFFPESARRTSMTWHFLVTGVLHLGMFLLFFPNPGITAFQLRLLYSVLQG
jgi:hypothetical protein